MRARKRDGRRTRGLFLLPATSWVIRNIVELPPAYSQHHRPPTRDSKESTATGPQLVEARGDWEGSGKGDGGGGMGVSSEHVSCPFLLFGLLLLVSLVSGSRRRGGLLTRSFEGGTGRDRALLGKAGRGMLGMGTYLALSGGTRSRSAYGSNGIGSRRRGAASSSPRFVVRHTRERTSGSDSVWSYVLTRRRAFMVSRARSWVRACLRPQLRAGHGRGSSVCHLDTC